MKKNYGVRDAMESFINSTVPKNASKAQINDMSKAFIAGGFSVFNFMIATSELPEDQAVKAVEKIDDEIAKMVSDIVRGGENVQ